MINKIYSQDSNRVNNLEFEWGNNIFGNTISLGYTFNLNQSMGIGLSLSKGNFSYDVGSSGKFFFFKNLRGKENIVKLDLKQVIDLKFIINSSSSFGFSYFNRFEFGVSHISVLYKNEYEKENFEGKFVGEKEFNLYGANLYLSFCMYKPKKSCMSFLLGTKVRFTILSGQQKIFYYNWLYPPEYSYISSPKRILLIYPEFCLTFQYAF